MKMAITELISTRLGVPTEGYGVSDGARSPKAPAEFAKAALELRDQNKSVTIDIAY
jgi:uncharacterized protein (DUF2141 family)